MAVLGSDFVASQAHISLNRPHHGAALVPIQTSRTDPAAALDVKWGSNSIAFFPTSTRPPGSKATTEGSSARAGFRIGDDPGTALFHNSDKAIGGAQVDAENQCHLIIPLRSIVLKIITL